MINVVQQGNHATGKKQENPSRLREKVAFYKHPSGRQDMANLFSIVTAR